MMKGLISYGNAANSRLFWGLHCLAIGSNPSDKTHKCTDFACHGWKQTYASTRHTTTNSSSTGPGEQTGGHRKPSGLAMPQATRLLWLLLAVLALPGAAGQSYWLYSGQSGAQTQIDVDHTSTWTIQVTSGTLLFAGARLTMKRGPSSSTSVTLSLYQGNSAAGTLLGTATLANNAFGPQFNQEEFALSSPLTLNPGTYFVALTSPAPDVQSQAYFIKGVTDSLVSINGTPGSQPSNVATSPNLIPRMTLEKTAPATITTNSNLVYTFNLGNEGSGAIIGGTSVVVADQLPAGTTYVSAAPGTNVTSVSCVQGTPLLNCTVVLSANGIPAATVAADGPSFTVTVTTSSSTGSITNYASVAEDGISPPPAPGAACTLPNCASATTLVTVRGCTYEKNHGIA